MLVDSIELPDEIKWTLRPRKFKRKCEYLENENNKLFLLPPSSLQIKHAESQTIYQPTKKPCLNKPKVLTSLFNFSYNPALYIVSLHLFLNFFIVAVLIFTISYILLCAGRDISYKISLKKSETLTLIEEAKKLYILNKCDPTTRVPALQLQCDQWDHLIRHGFYSIKYTKIVIEMFADVLDGFVAKFKFKSLAVIITFMCVYLTFRRKH